MTKCVWTGVQIPSSPLYKERMLIYRHSGSLKLRFDYKKRALIQCLFILGGKYAKEKKLTH